MDTRRGTQTPPAKRAPRERARPALLCLVPFLFAAGCASAGSANLDPSGIQLSPWTPPEGQQCTVSDAALPPFGEVFDSLSVGQEVAGIAAGGGTGTLILAVSVSQPDPEDDEADAELPETVGAAEPRAAAPGGDPAGGDRGGRDDPEDPGPTVSLHILESTLSDADATRLVDILEQGVLPDAKVGAQLRVDTEPPRFRFGERIVCSPAMANRDEIQGALVEAAQSGLAGRVLLQMYVNEDGAPVEVNLKEGSGYFAVDAAAVRVASLMRFHPALYNRVPIAVWVSIPLSMRPPPEPEEPTEPGPPGRRPPR